MSAFRRDCVAALAATVLLTGPLPACSSRAGPTEVAPLRVGWSAPPHTRITWRQEDVEVSMDRIPAEGGFGGRIVNLGPETVVATFQCIDHPISGSALGSRWLGRTRLTAAVAIRSDEPVEIPPADPAVEEPERWLGFVLVPTRVASFDQVRHRLVVSTSRGDLVWPLEFEEVPGAEEFAPPLGYDEWWELGLGILLLPLFPLYLLLNWAGWVD